MMLNSSVFISCFLEKTIVPPVVVFYEAQDVNYCNTWYTRVLVKGTCGKREWIEKGLLPDTLAVDQAYSIDAEKYHAVYI